MPKPKRRNLRGNLAVSKEDLHKSNYRAAYVILKNIEQTWHRDAMKLAAAFVQRADEIGGWTDALKSEFKKAVKVYQAGSILSVIGVKPHNV